MERKLPDPDRGRLSRKTLEEYQRYDREGYIPEKEFSDRADALEKTLKKWGLGAEEAELMIDRFVSKLTLKEIRIKGGYTSEGAVYYLINRTLNRLKEAGFRIDKYDG